MGDRQRAIFGALALVVVLTLAAGFGAAATAPPAHAQETDEEVPPGNPVIGSDAPGDVDPNDDGTSYALLAGVAICLIGAGVLLVKVERWERRRSTT